MEEDGKAPAAKVLIPAVNQVAGHRGGVAKVGPLVDNAGQFYKPLQDGHRGDREIQFYEEFWSDITVPESIKTFFPRFYGVERMQASDGSGLCDHIALEDLTHGYLKPSIMDIKMGFHTSYPGASEQYLEKCRKKDEGSTSKMIGYRISGFQVYDESSGTIWKPERSLYKQLTVENTKPVLKSFVSKNPKDVEHADGAYAPLVYGGPNGIIKKLTDLQAWFEEQTQYHFYSSSLLFIYEVESRTQEGEEVVSSSCSVKLVDFAHALSEQTSLNHNFLAGLKVLIEHLTQIASGSSA